MTSKPNYTLEKRQHLPTNDADQMVWMHVKNTNRSKFITLQELNLKWSKNLSPDILNLIEMKEGNGLKLIGTEDNFLNRTLGVQTGETAINGIS